MKKASSPRPAYLDVLGFKSEDDLTNHITGAIREVIREKRGESLPVTVSAAAEAFGIMPKPIIEEMPRDGAIQFESSENRFVIRINQSNWTSINPKLDSQDNETTPEISLLYRSRFTYAHEFAHRFFFLPKACDWQRAVVTATEGLPDDERRVAFRNLYNYEETLCNRIAGDVLVPESHLVRILGDSLGKIETLHLALRKASYEFRVSQECILVRIGRAIHNSIINSPPNLCIFLITKSEHKGGHSRSRTDLRVREAILPKKVLGVKVNVPFAGLAIRNLGQEALSIAEATVASEPGSNSFPANLTINLVRADRSGLIATRLTGWSRRLYPGKGGQTTAEGLLLWGLLNSV